MSRVQLALNVSDLDAAIEFYSTLFQTPPAKVRPGYANFAIAEPPLKLVLVAGGGAPGTLNHLGVEVFTTEEVGAATTRLAAAGLATEAESGTCCYAEQDKVWVSAPDGEPWEVYTVLADADADPASAITPGADCVGDEAAGVTEGCCVPSSIGASAGCC